LKIKIVTCFFVVVVVYVVVNVRSISKESPIAREEDTETEKVPFGAFLGTYPNSPPCPLSLVGRKVLPPEFQGTNLIREVRKCKTKKNRQARQNNNSLAIKQGQGFLVPPQGL